jgi:amidase
MRRLSSKKHTHTFSPRNRPAYRSAIGETLLVETEDAFSGLVTKETVLFEDTDMADVNPATGPIEVEGVRAGDVLGVRIERIDCGPIGVVMCSPEIGILASEVRRSRTKIVQVRGGLARMSKDLEVALRPHVGVIGVSPAEGEFPTIHPGDFGGNMDTGEAGPGSVVYLPVFVDGAMLAMGDVHAAMGDGEVGGTGIEVSADVTVTLLKADQLELKRPMIETPTEWIAYAAAKSLDEAAKLATHDLVRFIANARGVDFEEAYMLASVAADLRISQVVDPLMAARMSISKKYL